MQVKDSEASDTIGVPVRTPHSVRSSPHFTQVDGQSRRYEGTDETDETLIPEGQVLVPAPLLGIESVA